MDLSRYEKMMERRMERTAFPISEAELCQRYEKLYTGAVNDVLREEGLIMQTLPNGIMPLREEMTVCGIAFTEEGMNYKDYLSSVRMEKAAALLREGKLNVSQVAQEVGYGSLKNFSAAFKSYFGVTAREMRRGG